MLRFLIAALVLSGAGAGLFFYFGFEYAVYLPFFSLFAQRAVSRFAFKFLLLLLIYPLLPDSWRRAIERTARRYKKYCAWCMQQAIDLWKGGAWWVRLIIVVIGALCAGLFAGILLIMPVHVRRVPLVGEALQKKTIPWLLHRSALGELDKRLPDVAKTIPLMIRRTVGHYYHKLWWATAKPLWESRQTLTIRMERWLEQEGQEKKVQTEEDKKKILEQHTLP